VCCSELQCVAVNCVCCSVLHCFTVWLFYSVLQSGAVCCSVLQCVAVCCSVLQCVAVCCSVLQCVAVCCSDIGSVLHLGCIISQCIAVRCRILQCVAVCRSVLQCVVVCIFSRHQTFVTEQICCTKVIFAYNFKKISAETTLKFQTTGKYHTYLLETSNLFQRATIKGRLFCQKDFCNAFFLRFNHLSDRFFSLHRPFCST